MTIEKVKEVLCHHRQEFWDLLEQLLLGITLKGESIWIRNLSSLLFYSKLHKQPLSIHNIHSRKQSIKRKEGEVQ